MWQKVFIFFLKFDHFYQKKKIATKYSCFIFHILTKFHT